MQMTLVDCELERQTLDLVLNYDKTVNQVLNYLQRGHVWDPMSGWDGEENRLRIHENDMTLICQILLQEGRIVAYEHGNYAIYCSKMQWSQWATERPGIDTIRITV